MDDYDGPLEAAIALVDEFADRNDTAAAQAREALASAAEAADETARAYEELQQALGEYVRKTAEASQVLEANARYQDAVKEATEKTAFAMVAAGRAADALENDYKQLAAVEEAVANRAADLEHGQAMVAQALGYTERQVDELTRADWELAAAEHAVGDAAVTMAAKAAIADKALDTAGQRGFRYWGLTRNALHWIISLGAEIIAVVGPALVATGAWMAVVYQGAENAYVHMNSLYDATEATGKMFHTTMGDALGLGHALQTAQNMADPMVYQNLGSALIIVREHFGDLAQTGLQVEKIFTQFMAKLAYEFSPQGGLGASVDGLLKQMVPDLIKIAQVIGNTVHALAGFANSMPGLAEVLLGVLSNITKLASVLLNNPIGHYLVLIGVGFEEAYRWGGLFGRILGRFAGLLGSAGEHLAVFAYKFGPAGLGRALEGAGGSLGRVANFLKGPWGFATVTAAIGLGVLIYKIATMKDATQQWVDSLQSATQAASNFTVYGTIVANLTKLTDAYASAKDQYDKLVQAGSHGQIPPNPHWLSFQTQKLSELHHGMTQQQQDMTNVGQGMTYLAKEYKTSYVGALALAQEAQVNLGNKIIGQSKDAEILRFKIASLVSGYKAMGQPIGAVGKDMDALSIYTMEQQSKVQQLNQAWDNFMQNLTGGTQNMAQFEQSITNLTTGTNKITNILGKGGSVTLSINNFAQSLQNMGSKGQQAWQNFDQVVGSTAPQLIDWLRTAGSEGELSGTKFTQAIKDIVAQMEPFAKDSHTATSELSGLAQEASGPATDSISALKGWTDKSHTSISNLQDIIGSTTQKMTNMGQVAQNLGAVMQQDIISTMDTAKLKVDDVGQATIQYTQDLKNNGSQSAQTHTAYDNLVQVLTRVTGNNREANQIAQTYARSMGDDKEKAYQWTQQNNALGSSLRRLPKEELLKVSVHGVGQWIAPLGQAAGHVALHAAGGIVRGGEPHRDSVHAMLMPGEGVLTTKAVSMIGEHTVHHLNRMAESGALGTLHRTGGMHRMASGGIVPSYSGSPGGLGPWAKNDYTATVNAMAKAMRSEMQQAMTSMGGPAGGRTSAGGSYNVPMLEHLWESAGGPAGMARLMAAIALAESGGNPAAHNPSGASGLWQILGSIVPGNVFNPYINALNAVAKWRSQGLGAWVTYTSGAYREYMDQGGWLKPGTSMVTNNTGKPERVVGPNEEVVVPVTVMLDSQVLFKSVQRSGRQYTRRQGGRGGGDRVFASGA